MMKFTALCLLPALVGSLSAQVEIPPNPRIVPRGLPTRSVGGGVDPGATLVPGKSSAPLVKTITHVVLSPSRSWTNADGKAVDAKLIAFEDLVSTGNEPAAPAPPARPTVVRDGKVRLLTGAKPAVVALEKLSEPDRNFVATVEASIAARVPVTR